MSEHSLPDFAEAIKAFNETAADDSPDLDLFDDGLTEAASSVLRLGGNKLTVAQPMLDPITLIMIGQLLLRIFHECGGRTPFSATMATARRPIASRLRNRLKAKVKAAAEAVPELKAHSQIIAEGALEYGTNITTEQLDLAAQAEQFFMG